MLVISFENRKSGGGLQDLLGKNLIVTYSLGPKSEGTPMQWWKALLVSNPLLIGIGALMMLIVLMLSLCCCLKGRKTSVPEVKADCSFDIGDQINDSGLELSFMSGRYKMAALPKRNGHLPLKEQAGITYENPEAAQSPALVWTNPDGLPFK
jgi:hypothetical protein